MLDSKNPANSHVEATIDPNSLASDNPPPGFLGMLHGAEWLNAGAFPQITFQPTKIVMTAPNKADVTGDLTLHGVTKQVTLHTTFNRGWAKMPLDSGGARIGYWAKGSLDRSDFGITMGFRLKAQQWASAISSAFRSKPNSANIRPWRPNNDSQTLCPPALVLLPQGYHRLL
jgi:polyisoprenoid-binding protein YceI